jgi:hypothetical protein
MMTYDDQTNTLISEDDKGIRIWNMNTFTSMDIEKHDIYIHWGYETSLNISTKHAFEIGLITEQEYNQVLKKETEKNED